METQGHSSNPALTTSAARKSQTSLSNAKGSQRQKSSKDQNPQIVDSRVSVWSIDLPPGKSFNDANLESIKNELIEKLGGEPYTMRHSKTGSLIVELGSMQADRLMSLKILDSSEVSVNPYGRHINSSQSRGTIFAEQIADKSEENILKSLKSQRVMEVQRLPSKNSSKPSPIFLLTFSTPDVPSHIKVQTSRFQVRTRLPRPTRCTNCQQFRHSFSECTLKTPTCSTCGKKGHKMTGCRRSVKCANCGGPHAASDLYCPAYLQEDEVIRLNKEENIGFNEARVLARNTYPYTVPKI